MTDSNSGTGGRVDRAVQALIDAAGHQTAAPAQALIDASGHQTAAQVQAAIRTALVGHATTVALTTAVNAIRQLPAGGDDGQILGRASGAPAWVASSSVLPDTLARVLDPWPAYPPGGARAGQPFFKGGDDAAGPRGWYEPIRNPVQPPYRFRVSSRSGLAEDEHAAGSGADPRSPDRGGAVGPDRVARPARGAAGDRGAGGGRPAAGRAGERAGVGLGGARAQRSRGRPTTRR